MTKVSVYRSTPYSCHSVIVEGRRHKYIVLQITNKGILDDGENYEKSMLNAIRDFVFVSKRIKLNTICLGKRLGQLCK